MKLFTNPSSFGRVRKFFHRRRTSMDSNASDEAYLLNRDAEESRRLNAQHTFLVEVIGGSPIHPSIPTENIQTIADAATGTGVWLFDIASTLHRRHPSKSRLTLQGFDISNAQFPFAKRETPQDRFRFSTQDILHPFPKEHLDRYDLVHVRLLVGALKEVDYPQAVRNLYTLLKPGGYLQWDDCDTTAFVTDNPTPIDTEMRRVIVDAVDKLGLCPTAPQYVQKLAIETGFVDVNLHHNSTADKPYLRDQARTWLALVLRALMPHAMVKSGEVPDERTAIETAEALVADYRSQTSSLPLVNLYVLVARKLE